MLDEIKHSERWIYVYFLTKYQINICVFYVNIKVCIYHIVLKKSKYYTNIFI
jgi:hypothetical protein